MTEGPTLLTAIRNRRRISLHCELKKIKGMNHKFLRSPSLRLALSTAPSQPVVLFLFGTPRHSRPLLLASAGDATLANLCRFVSVTSFKHVVRYNLLCLTSHSLLFTTLLHLLPSPVRLTMSTFRSTDCQSITSPNKAQAGIAAERLHLSTAPGRHLWLACLAGNL